MATWFRNRNDSSKNHRRVNPNCSSAHKRKPDESEEIPWISEDIISCPIAVCQLLDNDVSLHSSIICNEGWLVGCVLRPIDGEDILRGHPHLLCLGKDVKLGFYAVPTGNRTPGRRVAVHYTTAAPHQLLL